jgi:hypothetical protein
MGNKCGKSYKKITTTTKLSFTQKKLKKGTYYKYMILAVNAKNKVIAVSKTLHVATKGGKVGNYKSVKITNAKSTLTLKKGKKMKLKAKAMKADKKVRNHRKIKFESSKPSVVKITAGGKLTAKKADKGTGACHDDDRLARSFYEFAPIRAIAEAAGFTLTEMFNKERLAKSCGTSVAMAYMPEITKKVAGGRWQDMLRTEAASMLVASPPAYECLSSNIPEGKALVDLFSALDEVC